MKELTRTTIGEIVNNDFCDTEDWEINYHYEFYETCVSIEYDKDGIKELISNNHIYIPELKIKIHEAIGEYNISDTEYVSSYNFLIIKDSETNENILAEDTGMFSAIKNIFQEKYTDEYLYTLECVFMIDDEGEEE